jgi:hypothetical protein
MKQTPKISQPQSARDNRFYAAALAIVLPLTGALWIFFTLRGFALQ